MTTPPHGAHGSIAALSEDECLALLETTTIGRIAFVDDEGQQLIPVNFVTIDGDIIFRTLPDGFLSRLAKGHDDVAFGIDHNDVYGIAWNVTVRGSARQADDATVTAQALSHPRLKPWSGGDRTLVIRVTPRSVAGRRVARRWD